jgi:hypothetical protein
VRSAALNSTFQCFWDVAEIQRPKVPHPSHKQGSPCRRRDTLYAGKQRVLCDSILTSVTFTEQFEWELQSLPCKSQYSYNCVTFFTSLLSSLLNFLHISTFFTPLLSSHCTFFTSLLSSRLNFLHMSTFFTSVLSSHLCCLHFLTFFTPLLSSHLYFLHICTFFTSLLSSLLNFLHTSTFFTSLLSSHHYFRHISTVFTCLLSSLFENTYNGV